MKIQKVLMNSRAGRMLLSTLGMGVNRHSISYFSYRVGSNSERKEGDYYLYFKKGNVPAKVVDNFAFNEMVDSGAAHGMRFLQFQLAQAENKEVFLRYLQVAIPNRKSRYSKEKHEILDYCLTWVNEHLKSLSGGQPGSQNQNTIALVNTIQIRNENDHFISIPDTTSQLQKEIVKIKEGIRDLFARSNNTEYHQNSDAPVAEYNQLIERMERLETSIARLAPGRMEMAGEKELKQFVFLLLALQSYRIDNKAQSPYFFKQFSKVDMTGLLKSNFKYYNSKTSKTTEKDVYKFDEEFKSLDLESIHKDLKKLFGDFR